MKIVTQLNLDLPNNPGSLARMSDALRSADVNIDALFCTEGESDTRVHVVTNDPETAKIVLKKFGPVTATEVIALSLSNRPGAIAQVSRMCAGAGINIRQIYATSHGKEATLHLLVDDMEKARKLLK